MKIAIIGAGAMGSLYGGCLSVNNQVYLIDIWKDHVDEINTNGLTIVDDCGEAIYRPHALTDSKTVESVDLAIVFVKSISTKEALKANESLLGKDTLVLSLQNGYGNADDMLDFVSKDNIIVGTTSHGATLLSKGRIKHAGKGATHIGAFGNMESQKLEQVAKILSEAGFETVIDCNILELVWSKLFANVGINGLTGILRIKNGQLTEFEQTMDLMRNLVSEAVAVANSQGMHFDENTVFDNVVNIAKKTYENNSSMLQDVLNGRKTEIEKINGAVINIGKSANIDTPYNQTIMGLIEVLDAISK